MIFFIKKKHISVKILFLKFQKMAKIKMTKSSDIRKRCKRKKLKTRKNKRFVRKSEATKKPLMALPTTRGEHALMHVRGQQKHVDSGVKKIFTTQKLPLYKYTDTQRHLHSCFNRNLAKFEREREREGGSVSV